MLGEWQDGGLVNVVELGEWQDGGIIEVLDDSEPVLNTWPDPSQVLASVTWYENGVLKTGTAVSGGASLLYVIATN